MPPVEPGGGGENGWVRACAESDLEDDEGYRVESVPPVSIFRSDGELFCIDDTCTHEEYSLADGWVEDCVVECSLHMARYDLRTGEALGPPAIGGVKTHQVRVDEGEVFVRLPADYEPAKD